MVTLSRCQWLLSEPTLVRPAVAGEVVEVGAVDSVAEAGEDLTDVEAVIEEVTDAGVVVGLIDEEAVIEEVVVGIVATAAQVTGPAQILDVATLTLPGGIHATDVRHLSLVVVTAVVVVVEADQCVVEGEVGEDLVTDVVVVEGMAAIDVAVTVPGHTRVELFSEYY